MNLYEMKHEALFSFGVRWNVVAAAMLNEKERSIVSQVKGFFEAAITAEVARAWK